MELRAGEARGVVRELRAGESSRPIDVTGEARGVVRELRAGEARGVVRELRSCVGV